MAQFDELDARTAAAVGRTFEDEVIWRPMRASGGDYVVHAVADPARPIRAIPAIVSWAVTGLPVEGSPQSQGGGMVGAGTLLIDFELMQFQDGPWAQFGEPVRGDWIEMPFERKPANRMVEITRIGDDGSARFYAWCSLVNPS